MGQGRGVFYPLNLRINQRQYLLFYLTIVGFDSLFEIIGAIFVFEFHYHWDRLVCFHFCRHLDAIHHYLRMENLLVDALVEVIGHRTHEYTLCEVGNLACRDKAIHLRGNGGGFVVAVDGHGLPLL